jgi:NAD(P)-dependent dehydrogenase (short-subunit alcohol dehydrogenase family)
LFAGLEAGLGGAPLDILVNNAGILDLTPLEQVTPEAFDRSYAVNVRAPFFIVQRALPLLRDGGRIINLSSAATRIASPFTHYAMNKGAIEVLSHALAQALGPRGITVNTVTPGVIDTDMGALMHSSAEVEAAIVSTTALGRVGQPADVADVIAFLASHGQPGSSALQAAPWRRPVAQHEARRMVAANRCGSPPGLSPRLTAGRGGAIAALAWADLARSGPGKGLAPMSAPAGTSARGRLMLADFISGTSFAVWEAACGQVRLLAWCAARWAGTWPRLRS